MLVSPWRSLAYRKEPSASFINRCERKKVTYSADLWGSSPKYLGDNIFFYASTELIFEIGIRSLVQDTLSSMSVVFHQISFEFINSKTAGLGWWGGGVCS